MNTVLVAATFPPQFQTPSYFAYATRHPSIHKVPPSYTARIPRSLLGAPYMHFVWLSSARPEIWISCQSPPLGNRIPPSPSVSPPCSSSWMDVMTTGFASVPSAISVPP